ERQDIVSRRKHGELLHRNSLHRLVLESDHGSGRPCFGSFGKADLQSRLSSHLPVEGPTQAHRRKAAIEDIAAQCPLLLRKGEEEQAVGGGISLLRYVAAYHRGKLTGLRRGVGFLEIEQKPLGNLASCGVAAESVEKTAAPGSPGSQRRQHRPIPLVSCEN